MQILKPAEKKQKFAVTGAGNRPGTPPRAGAKAGVAAAAPAAAPTKALLTVAHADPQYLVPQIEHAVRHEHDRM